MRRRPTLAPPRVGRAIYEIGCRENRSGGIAARIFWNSFAYDSAIGDRPPFELDLMMRNNRIRNGFARRRDSCDRKARRRNRRRK